MQYRLSIDFGTTNTAASVQVPGGEPRPLRLGTRSDSIPSGVTLYGGNLVVAEEAARLALLDPSAHEPTPKRRLSEQSIALGGQLVQPKALVSALLARVLQTASRRMNGTWPEQTILSHPQTWADPRRELLVQAAVDAGLPAASIVLVSEPVSAAWHYAATTEIRPGDRIAVVDFGGGTFDVAVLSRVDQAGPGGSGFQVLSRDGIDPLGGHDFDDLLYGWVLRQLQLVGRTDVIDRLESPAGLAAQLTLREQIREAKHALSDYQSAPVMVIVGEFSTQLIITTAEFEAMIKGQIDTAVELAGRTISAAGDGRDGMESLRHLFLTGGSSLIPLVQREFQQLTGGKVGTIDDPKQVTSLGALSAPDLLPTGAGVPVGPPRSQPTPPAFPAFPATPPGFPPLDTVPIPTPVGPDATKVGWPQSADEQPTSPLPTTPTIPTRPPGERKKKSRTVWITIAALLALLLIGGSGVAVAMYLRGQNPEPGPGSSTPATPTPRGPTPGSTPGTPGGSTTPESPTSPTTPEPGTCDASLSTAQCTLAKSLTMLELESCTAQSSSEFLTCRPATLGSADPSTYIYVRQYADNATLVSDADFYFNDYHEGLASDVGEKLDDPPAKTTWHVESKPDQKLGLVYAVVTAYNEPTILWSVDATNVLLIAQAKEGKFSSLLAWWRE